MWKIHLLLLVVRAVRHVDAALFSNVTLFDYEKTQLTDHNLAQLPTEYQAYFGFDDSAVNATFTHVSGACKLAPGEDGYPSARTWEGFNATNIVNGALIAPKPIASPCYNSWGAYDEQKCAAITANWSNPYLQ
jgi:hypothetical protein